MDALSASTPSRRPRQKPRETIEECHPRPLCKNSGVRARRLISRGDALDIRRTPESSLDIDPFISSKDPAGGSSLRCSRRANRASSCPDIREEADADARFILSRLLRKGEKSRRPETANWRFACFAAVSTPSLATLSYAHCCHSPSSLRSVHGSSPDAPPAHSVARPDAKPAYRAARLANLIFTAGSKPMKV